MSLLGWLQARRAKRDPEARWIVGIDKDRISITAPRRKTRSLDVADLYAVGIEINDMGPWGIDMWWRLFDGRNTPSYVFPHGATGDRQVIDRLMRLDGFDHEKMIEAQRCTENAFFTLWLAPGEG